jgi:glycerol-1-phosphate dehydrogenase [NAD(P)+]
LLNSQSNDLIISVGGGKVGDLCKKLALDNNIPVVIVPTLISNDGLISPISVINNTKGGTDSIPGAIPFGVIIDLEIIEKSPEKYIFSAAGDILSNLSATQDWIYASKTKKVQINDIAFHLSKTSALALIDRNFSRVNDKNTIRHIVSGQINSGIAMTLAGNSRPCSGSEHLISHSIDKHKLSEDLHGEQVGKLSLFSLFLQGKLDDRILNYAKKINLLNPPKALENLKDFNKIIYDARLMRPNRATILDKYSNKEIRTFYENWIEKLNDFNK